MPIKRSNDELEDGRRNRANKNKLKIVMLQLKTVIPLMDAKLDVDTAEDISSTLKQCAESCEAVARESQQRAARMVKAVKLTGGVAGGKGVQG